MSYAVFSENGRQISNDYPQYRATIESADLATHAPVALAVVGDADDVRAVTKKFSFYS